MKTDLPQTIYLKDYKPYPFKLHGLDLNFDIHDGHTIVTARTRFERVESSANEIFLNGEELELLSLKIDGQEIKTYTQDEVSLRVPCSADQFDLEIITKIYPEKNTRLEGLYMSGGNYCTQCEAEGFRRITYFPDRPDVLSTYSVRIEADRKFPVLLSNGNPVESGEASDGRHYASWHDPFPKPCYLFALVAGDLAHIHDTYTTCSGKNVDLFIYVRPGDEGQCGHAMESLKKSMRWDEDTYGLEYDLDLFNIVAVSDFNMGAMENKSLNIFNTALVLAAQETATDNDFIHVESVIAHEYFHNWSGNRVTCRDWFQLSLKEGLTVFRDQEFSADMNARAVQRIDDVTHLRRLQFAEDAGPLSHPVRPDNYIEINNFYTMTVYEKGAEVIRMMRTLLGPKNYRKGTDLYFKRHDGQAVTCDDFAVCMQEASGVDLSHFKLWYSQAGTPEVMFKGRYDAKTQTYSVELSQYIPDTPGQTGKKPMLIPVLLGLLAENGADIPFENGETTKILQLSEEKQVFEFKNIPSKPVPSVLRNFSAPVKLETELGDSDLAFLMRHDSDGFNRWEAGQQLAGRILHTLTDAIEAGREAAVPVLYLEAVGEVLAQGMDAKVEYALLARALELPSVSYIGQQRMAANPPAIYAARQSVLKAIKAAHREKLAALYEALAPDSAFSLIPQAMGKRALRGNILALLAASYGENCAKRAKAHYDAADNMTDRVAGLAVLTHIDHSLSTEAFGHFYNKFKGYPLVVDKWFSLQAISIRPDINQILKNLMDHPDFNIKNPNRVRSVYGAFALNNPVSFHAANGSGYAFLTEAIITLNTINPQIGARLLTPLREWKRYTPDRQALMQKALQDILATPDLASDIFEIASKSLKA